MVYTQIMVESPLPTQDVLTSPLVSMKVSIPAAIAVALSVGNGPRAKGEDGNFCGKLPVQITSLSGLGVLAPRAEPDGKIWLAVQTPVPPWQPKLIISWTVVELSAFVVTTEVTRVSVSPAWSRTW